MPIMIFVLLVAYALLGLQMMDGCCKRARDAKRDANTAMSPVQVGNGPKVNFQGISSFTARIASTFDCTSKNRELTGRDR